MPATASQILGLPYLQPAQAQKHVTHNEALRRLDVLVQLVVSSRSTAAPPADPPDGRRHIVPDGATGAWAGQEGRLAVFQETAWIFIQPLVGWQAYVKDENIHVTFEAGAWTASALPTALQNLSMAGINTTADSTNRLAVAADATLLSHDSADHRLKINKNAGGDTASLLFQSGFTGHAEMGLAGSQDFSLRVSPDGSTWTTGLTIDRTSGTPAAPAGLEVTGALTGSGVVGTVAQAGGLSTGAIIERGSNANGDYVRWADGTQICSGVEVTGVDANIAANFVFRSNSVDWTFPAAFADLNRIVGGAVVTGSVAEASHWVSCRPLFPTSMRIGLWANIARTGRSFRPFAVGTWY